MSGVGAEPPVLVAVVADEGVRTYLEGVARMGGDAFISLAAPPLNNAPHILEVRVASGAIEPLRLVAVPLGPPSTMGWPLRLTLPSLPKAPSHPSVDIPDLEIQATPTPSPSLSEPPAELRATSRSSAPRIVPDLAPLEARPPRRSSAPVIADTPSDPGLPAIEDIDWLEHGTAHASSAPKMADTRSSAPPAHAIDLRGTSSPGADPSITSFLRSIAETSEVERFTALVSPLGGQLKALLEKRDAIAIWRICSTLELIASESSSPRLAPPSEPRPRTRADVARAVLELFRHPDLLAPLAMQALEGTDADGAAQRLLVRAGKRGARALYQARLKQGSTEARTRFVAALKLIGPPSLPMFKSAFEHLEPRLGVAGAVSIAEDLLHAVPNASDEPLNATIARCLRSPDPMLAVAATEAAVRIWGEKARAALVEQAAHPHPAVVLIALKHLRGFGSLRLSEIERLGRIVANEHPLEARLAALEIVARAGPDAHLQLQELLQQTLARVTGPDDLVVALSSALLRVGGHNGAIVQRWRTSSGPLRDRLEAVLKGP